MKLYFTTFFTLITVCYCENDFPFVSTKLGDIKGHYKTSCDGKKFAAFEGIPFAAPPVGNLRFKDPEPVSPWEGIWDATHTYVCLQSTNMFSSEKTTTGGEDCLYINVYVPHQQPIPNENLEVFVHIHGGAFMGGTGHGYAQPDYLIDRNVILVTFNYRLGIFGFLSTGDEAIPGNYGLKDQTMALKWIKEHISSFGGNPNSVTLTGASAGSASVHYHYISPWSKGLFHRGQATSGTVLNPWVLQEQPLVKAKQLAASVGCPTENTKDLANCLRNRPAALIYNYLGLFYRVPMEPLSPFAPVIDKNSPNPFVPDHPFTLLSQGKIANDVPLILSASADEGLLFIAFYYDNVENLNENWSKVAPYALDYNFTADKSNWETIARKTKEQYLGGEDFSKETFKQFSDMVGDRLFLDGIEYGAKLQAKFSKSPIYFYFFNYEGSLSLIKGLGMLPDYDGGVPHVNDVQFVFTNKISGSTASLTNDDRKMRDIFLDFLISYAKTNVPEIPNVEWKPTTYEQLTYLNISGPDNIKLITTKELTPRKFWQQLGILENENFVHVKEEL